MAGARLRLAAFACALGAALASAAPTSPGPVPPGPVPPPPSAGEPETWRYASRGRVVAFGDVHGAYGALVATLRQAGVIDAEGRWTGGTTTLVSVGDLVDRGPSSRQVLDLLMRLEREAAAAGGAVRVVLGNHEVMTLIGELRDASEEEVAEFAADERPAERAAAKARYVARRIAAGATEVEALEAFARRFPPGWFARRAAFAADGRYGAWLLSKPAAIVVDRTAFVHGGLSRVVADRDLVALNAGFRARLAQQLADVVALERAALIDFSLRGEDRAEALALRLPPDPAPGAAVARPANPAATASGKPPPVPIAPPHDAVAERVVRFDLEEPLFRMYGPVWYRGYAMCHAATESDVAAAAVARLGVDRIVVGHTPTQGARIRSRFDGRVLTVDTGMLKRVYGGQGAVLEITAAGLTALYQDGTRSPVEPEPRPVALGPLAGDAPLLRALAAWTVAKDERVAGDRRAIELVEGNDRIQAWFYPDHPKGGRHGRELGAHGLDRALGLGLVMPTVERNIGGVDGALQWRPTGAVTGAEAQAKPPQGTQWCDMPAQLELMYVWDALTLNEGRTLDSFAYTDEDWLLIASDHRRAFGERVARPGHLAGRTLVVGPALCKRLRALDAKALRTAVGKALSGKEQKALLARRDALVREAGCAR